MTDHHRFRIIQTTPDAAFRHYFGARQVDLVLRLADAWLRHRAQVGHFIRDTVKPC